MPGVIGGKPVRPPYGRLADHGAGDLPGTGRPGRRRVSTSSRRRRGVSGVRNVAPLRRDGQSVRMRAPQHHAGGGRGRPGPAGRSGIGQALAAGSRRQRHPGRAPTPPAGARCPAERGVRATRPAASLAPLLKDVTSHPHLSPTGVSWEIDAPQERRMAVEAVLAWSTLQETMPGRLRPCANPECRMVPPRPQQGQQGPLVLDGRLRQQDEGQAPLPAHPRRRRRRVTSQHAVAAAGP